MPRLSGAHWGEKPLRKIAAQTTSATIGTRTTHAHGFTDNVGNAKTPTTVIPVVRGVDGDTADAAGIVVFVKADATNVTVKSDTASVSFDLYVAG